MVDIVQKPLEARGQLRQTDARRRKRPPSDQVARHVGEEHLVHGTEQPLDLAPPAGATGPGMNESDLQRDAGLLDLFRDEIATVVDVEHPGNAADRPSRIGLAPDRVGRSASAVFTAEGASVVIM